MDDSREGVFKIDEDNSNLTKYPMKNQDRYLDDYGIRQTEFDVLNRARKEMHLRELIGVDGHGIGYGNISMRLKKGFMISGTQTSYVVDLNQMHYPIVFECRPEQNSITAVCPETDRFMKGLLGRDMLLPSSECMTHDDVYQLDNSVRAVIHVHSPRIWLARYHLQMPVTARGIEYGTCEMAREPERLWKDTDLKERKAFAMESHQDGVIFFGSSVNEVLGSVLEYYHHHAPRAIDEMRRAGKQIVPDDYQIFIGDRLLFC